MSVVRLVPAEAAERVPSTWWHQFHTNMSGSGRSPEAVTEIDRCSAAVMSHIPLPGVTPATERIVGAVVGAVQSGKTGLMTALAARGLDCGFRMILVLAGLKEDLRSQTALRFYLDLLQKGDNYTDPSGERRCSHPRGAGFHGAMGDRCWALPFYTDVHRDEAFTAMVSSRLRRDRSVLVVAKKNVATLSVLRACVEHVSERNGAGSMPILVLDDECDEATVSGNSEAPTPERIFEVWKDMPQYVSYVGLTATPAANLLQDLSSPFYPRKFVEILKTASDRDSAIGFREPEPDRRYTGGNAFYHMFEDAGRANPLVRTQMTLDEFNAQPGHEAELEEALIAYYVSGAIRLVQQAGAGFERPDARPAPHTMLAHTDAMVDQHWELCGQIVAHTRRNGGRDDRVMDNLRRMPPSRRISAEDLVVWLGHDTERWRRWYDDFQNSRRLLLEIAGDRLRAPYPSWELVLETLPTVFRNAKLRVINSDEDASDAALDFRPTYSDGRPLMPRDVYSIVIGGNRLSRGLTIEGLCVSYFTRTSVRHVEDTATQRERWFGYRGPHLEFCRLVTHGDVAIRLSRFQEHDDDLRQQLAWNLTHGRGPADATFRFLRLSDSMPTAKTGRGVPGLLNLTGVRLFVDRAQMGSSPEELAAASANEEWARALAERVLRRGREVQDTSGNTVATVSEEHAADEVATLLEGLRFTFHNPDPSRGVSLNIREYYRPPHPDCASTASGMKPSSDPFLIGAYLRFWTQAYLLCQQFPERNRFREVDGLTPWNPCPAPVFNLAVRSGSLNPAAGSPFRHQLLDRAFSHDGRLGSRWGGHGYGAPGDEWIDLPAPADPFAPRRRGEPGLVLLHVISREARGRDGSGTPYACDRPALGVVIPSGGPSISFVLAEGP